MLILHGLLKPLQNYSNKQTQNDHSKQQLKNNQKCIPNTRSTPIDSVLLVLLVCRNIIAKEIRLNSPYNIR